MEELTASKKRLEEILQKPVVCLSYPHSDMNETVKGWVKAAGYRAALLTEGANNTLKSDFFVLKRVPIPGQESLAAFARRVEGAYDWVWWFTPVVKFFRRLTGRKQG
jgi:hypothetical protein